MSHWQTVIAIDSDPAAAATYAVNFPGVRVECAPVSGLLEQLPDADVIIGGPPCQPFSTAGEMQGEADERDCIPDFIAAVKKKRPRMFLMENVRGLITTTHWAYFACVLNELEALGYVVEWKLLDAVSFGVPQFRERVWVWGIRADLGLKHQWPKPTHAWPPPEPSMFGDELKPGVTVGQALGLDGAIRKPRSKIVIRRDHPTDEPCPTVEARAALGGGSVLRFIGGIYDAQNEKVHGVDEPCGTIQGNAQAKGGQAGHYAVEEESEIRVIGGGSNPRFRGDDRTERDITDEPSTTIAAQHTHNALPAVQEYRWSDAMLQKHPPASPAPTVQAKYFKGGAEGLLAVDKPSYTVSGQSREPIQNWKSKGYIRRLTPLECARLQSVPDDFKWPVKITKTAMYRIVGNGWSSMMGKVFSAALHAVDPESKTVIDLFCGGGLGAVGWHGRAWEYQS